MSEAAAPSAKVAPPPPGASKKRTWARKQVNQILNTRMQREEGQNEYNIWYHKYLGDRDQQRERATTRCNPKLDSGMTKGSLTNPNAYLCVHFARGCCVYGPECIYLHRLPTEEDERRIDPLHDIFGRERHGADRDDMGGTGTFNRDCRTLYVGGILVSKDIDLEEIMTRHFGEWGLLEEVSVKRKFGCAFIRYKHRIYAEFAKIAMAEQSLEHGEQLNVRWAYDDPNPRVVQEIQEKKEIKMLEALESKGYFDNVDLDYNVPLGYQPPTAKAPVAPPPGMRALPAPVDEQGAAKKPRLENGGAASEAVGDGQDLTAEQAAAWAAYAPQTWYPDTDAQYAAASQQQQQLAAAYAAQSAYVYSDPAAYAAAAAAAGGMDPSQQAAWYQYQQSYANYATDGAYAGYGAYAAATDTTPSATTVGTGTIGPPASREEAAAHQQQAKLRQEAQQKEEERKRAVERMNALLNTIDTNNS